jgi:hypothetical protein
MEFESNDALVRWMEDEGLAPFTLLKVSPKPTVTGRKLPPSVVMEWGLEDLEYEGDREKFLAWRVTAEEIAVFRCDGTLDRFEECNADLGDGSNIDLRLEAGGKLVLRCQRLVVSDEPVERFRKGRPRPHHGEVNLELDLSRVTWGAVRGWLRIPTELSCRRHLTLEVVGDHATPIDAKNVTLVDAAGHNHVWLAVESNRLTISRGKWAPDELWTRIWSQLTSVPGVTSISSRDLVCPPGTWPEQPPRKPAPQVWPDVYGVACDFAELTLDELRRCLGLPANVRFVFDVPAALEPHPTLTLGDAARAVWRAPERLPNVRERHSRTTCCPPDPWPAEPPSR